MNDGGFNFTGRAKREPNADMRNFAKGLHEFYTALIGEGFDKKQALALTVVFMQEVMRNGMETGTDG